MMKNIVSAFIILILIFTITGCQKNDSKEVKEINIGYLRVPNDETIAKNQKYIDNYFEEMGIKVNYISVDSGVEANKAFASKSLDFASMGNTNGIVALATNLDTELVWIHEVLGSNEALVVKDSSSIRSIEDLRDKVIATTFSSTSHYILMNVLKEAGLEDQVTVLDMLTTDIVAAWSRGDIDGAYTWEPVLSELLERGGRVLVDSQEMANRGFITANIGLARKSFARENKELIAGLLLQLSRGADLYREKPDQAIEIAAEELGIDRQTAKVQMEGSTWLSLEDLVTDKYLGSQEKAGDFSRVMKDTSDFLQGQNSIKKSPSQEEYDNFINPIYIQMAIEMKKDQ